MLPLPSDCEPPYSDPVGAAAASPASGAAPAPTLLPISRAVTMEDAPTSVAAVNGYRDSSAADGDPGEVSIGKELRLAPW